MAATERAAANAAVRSRTESSASPAARRGALGGERDPVMRMVQHGHAVDTDRIDEVPHRT